jgi:hypothetical protein
MALERISPMPEHDASSSIYSNDTPPEGLATGTTNNEDDDPFEYMTISSAVPWPGSTYIIRSAGSAQVLTLLDGQVVLDLSSGRGSIYWQCVETKGWLGFRDPASGLFMGHNMYARLGCTAKRHSEWESFCARMTPNGGYVLLMTQWGKLWPLGVKSENGVQRLEKVEKSVAEGLVWDFVKVA